MMTLDSIRGAPASILDLHSKVALCSIGPIRAIADTLTTILTSPVRIMIIITASWGLNG